MKHTPENREYGRLAKKGSPSDTAADYNKQPSSKGLGEGIAGSREYGSQKQEPQQEEAEFDADIDDMEGEIDSGDDPMPEGEVGDFPGISEFSREVREESTIERSANGRDFPPKGDLEVLALLEARLTQHPAINIEQRGISVKNGQAELSGLVATESMKLRAQEVAESIPGVRSVVNKLSTAH